MGDKTGIEWCDATWNPIVGCSVVSPGCTNCYAMAQAARIQLMNLGCNLGGAHYMGTTQRVKGRAVWTGKVALAPDHIITAPPRWKRPRVIFVNSMGDLFHEAVPDEWIDRIFGVMAQATQHTFIVLTKRARRMRDYCSHAETSRRAWTTVPPEKFASSMFWHIAWRGGAPPRANMIVDHVKEHMGAGFPWPLLNVVLGVSAEDQERADERIPDLLATPAVARIVSAEPLLRPIRFEHPLVHLDGVIVGGESGKDARPMHADWARSIRDQCIIARVPFFFKQWGEWAPAYGDDSRERIAVPSRGYDAGFKVAPGARPRMIDMLGRSMMHRLGKKGAGRLLDGREHNDLPWRTPA